LALSFKNSNSDLFFKERKEEEPAIKKSRGILHSWTNKQKTRKISESFLLLKCQFQPVKIMAV
jgi:hypothetical protein